MKLILRFFAASCIATCALAASAQNAPAPETHGIAVASMDRSVKPGDDFYQYANGEWIKRTEIPPDRAEVDVFSNLADLSNKRTADLIEEIAKSNPPAGSGARKVADLYNSYMDEAAIEAKGLAPLRPHLEAITAIHDKRELARALGETLRADVDALNNTNFHTANLFGLWIAPGFNDSEHYTAYLLQGGLQLPDREYYLGDNEHARNLRAQYQSHISAILKLAGFTDTDARATRILELEHSIAQIHRSLADNEDIHTANNTWTQADFSAKAPGLDWAEYFRGAGISQQGSFIVWQPEAFKSEDIHTANNTWTQADFSAKAPGLDWAEYFRGAGISQQGSFIVWQPEAFKGESALVTSTSLDTWKDWLSFHLIEAYGGVLPKALADERFAFVGKVLSGTTQQRPRWQRGVFVVDGLLGDAVGEIYAQRYFSPEAKAQAQAMVANLIAAFRKRIEALS